MGNQIYEDGCDGCSRSKGIDSCRGGIIELPGDWVLNQYGATEGFLGWLALQPRYHRMDLHELTQTEIDALGRNLQRIDLALKQYWSLAFPSDPIGRVYIIYFFEGIFDNPRKEKWHSHIHLIPRTRALEHLLRKESPGITNAYKISTIYNMLDFPQAYIRNNDNVNALMSFLRGQLHNVLNINN